MTVDKIKIASAFLVLLMWSATEAKAIDLGGVTMDDGTCADGTMLIPKAMAMHCGISCADSSDSAKINECLNVIAKDAQGENELEEKIRYQTSKELLLIGIKNKALAGNYEEEQDELLEGGADIPDFSAASGGMESDENSDLRQKQEKNTKLSTQSIKNMVDIINVYSSKLILDFVDGFYRHDAPYRKVDDK